MYYIMQTKKPFETAAVDLGTAVKKHGFGVLHVHDLGATLRKKGIDFKEECKVFEVCNPKQAAKVLSVDMHLSMALPCRISVFTEKGQTQIGLIKPADMLVGLSQNESLRQTAQDVEESLIKMVDEAK